MAIKYKLLADQLRSELLRNSAQAGRKLPTEDELCRRYQVSRQTVRHALQVLSDEGLVETRHGSGTYSTGRISQASNQIAVITTFLDDYIFPTVLHDAQNVFSAEGYPTTVFATENHVSTERNILLKLLEAPVSGILVEGAKTALPSPNSDLYQQLRRAEVPIVFLHGIYAELSDIPCVSDDNYGGGYLLARYLMDRGHRRIAGIFKSDDMQGPQRYHGAVSALRDAGLPIGDQCFSWYDTEARYALLHHENELFLRDFVGTRLDGATAVICYNDEIAYHLIRVLLTAGRRVPEDVAVVSFDNSYYSQLGPLHITSLRHKNGKLGKVAADSSSICFGGSPPCPCPSSGN